MTRRETQPDISGDVGNSRAAILKVSVEHAHSRIKNLAWASIPVSSYKAGNFNISREVLPL